MCKVFKLRFHIFDFSKVSYFILLYIVATDIGPPLKDIIEYL